MTVVSNTVTDLASFPLPGITVTIEIQSGNQAVFHTSTDFGVSPLLTTKTDEDGIWTTNLYPNSLLSPVGTIYKVTEHVLATPIQYYIEVPDTVSEIVSDLLVTPSVPPNFSYSFPLTGDYLVVANKAARDALTPSAGQLVYVTSEGIIYYRDGILAQWRELSPHAGTSAPHTDSDFDGQVWGDTSADSLKARFDSVNQVVWPPQYYEATFGLNIKAAAILRRTTNQLITQGSDVPISFNAVENNLGPMYAGGAPTKLTVPSGCHGRYSIGGICTWAADADGIRVAKIRINGTVIIAQNTNLGTAPDNTVQRMYYLDDGDYVEFCVAQNAGNDLNVVAGSDYSPLFWAQWMGVGGE